MQTLLGRHGHHLDGPQVTELLDMSQDRGLDRFEVERRQNDIGPNAIDVWSDPGPLKRFLSQFQRSLVDILLAAGACYHAAD